jgi:hypothetical protein
VAYGAGLGAGRMNHRRHTTGRKAQPGQAVARVIANVFCPTGKGGGIKPNCKRGETAAVGPSLPGSAAVSGPKSPPGPPPRATAPGAPFFNDREANLPKVALQPVAADAGYKKLAEKAEVANKELQALLDLGKGIASQLGYQTVLPKNDDEIAARAAQPGGFLLLAPVKSERRSTEKVNADYGGDWRKLGDVARASICVDTVGELHKVVAKMREAGIEFAKAPKDRINSPTEVGYRDLMTHVKMPNGVVVELQLHLKTMMVAKVEGHKPYEVMRSLDAKKGAGGRLTPDEQAQYDKAVADSKRIYETAWQASQGSEGSGGR